MRSFFKSIFGWIRDQAIGLVLTSAFATTVVYPSIMGAIAIALGYLQALPSMHIFLGGLASVAFTTLTLTRWRDDASVHSAQHKLLFEGLEFSFDIDQQTKTIVGLQCVCLLKNFAYFPIQYKYNTDHFEVEGGFEKPYSPDQLSPVLLPNAVGTRTFGHIKLDQPIPFDGQMHVLKGKLHIAVQYDRKAGRFRFTSETFMKVRIRIFAHQVGEGVPYRYDLIASAPFEHR